MEYFEISQQGVHSDNLLNPTTCDSSILKTCLSAALAANEVCMPSNKRTAVDASLPGDQSQIHAASAMPPRSSFIWRRCLVQNSAPLSITPFGLGFVS
jgi:hypothetical protein